MQLTTVCSLAFIFVFFVFNLILKQHISLVRGTSIVLLVPCPHPVSLTAGRKLVLGEEHQEYRA